LNTSAIVWIVWLALGFWLTWAGFLWEVEYFRSPGPQFYRLLLTLLFAFPLVLAAYHRLRRAWFRWEPLMVVLPVIAGLVYDTRAALVAIAIVLATLAVGRGLRLLMKLCPEGPIEEIVVDAALGFGWLHCMLFLLGLAGLYTPAALGAFFAAALLLGARQLPGIGATLIAAENGWTHEMEFRSLFGSLLVLVSLALVVMSTMVILAPSLAFDVLAAHLPLVHNYASQHALRTPSYLPYGYYPQNIEVLMTAGYVLGGDGAAQMLPPVFFALALVAAYRIGRLCGFDRFASFAGVVFSAAIPFLHWTGSVAKNDLALAFFILAALLGYLRWLKARNFQWVLAAAFFLASAAGVKHIVIFAIPPLSLLFLHAAWSQRARLRSVAALAVTFMVFGLFWHTRTWLLTGNPVYPAAAAAATRAAVRYHGSVWQHVIFPYLRFLWEIFFRGRRYFESPLNQPLGIALVLFAPLWLLVRRRIAAAEMACLLFCGLYLAYWAATVDMIRYAVSPFILLTVLVTGRLIAFWRAMPKSIGFSVLIASAYALLFGLFGIAIQELNAPQLSYFAFRIDKPGYLREALATYRALEFVRQASQPGDRVFSVDACSVAYVRDPAAFDCTMWTHQAPPEIRAQIAAKDYHFLIVPSNHTELAPTGWGKVYGDKSFDVLRPDGSL
jgi:hypothetical protein